MENSRLRKTAVITGASAGIGREYAWQLGRNRGYDLVLVARRLDRLNLLRNEIENAQPSLKVRPIAGDLSVRDDRERILNEIDNLGMEIDLVVNNAGFGSVGAFSSSKLSWETDMVEVNCIAALHFCHHFLPQMRKRKSGTIINVASTISFQPFPFMATYGATKAFLRSLSLALSREVEEDNVLVLVHCPGPTESEFHLVAGLGNKFSYLPAMTAQQAVGEALRAMDRKQTQVINGGLNAFLSAISSLLPDRAVTKLVAAVMKKHA